MKNKLQEIFARELGIDVDEVIDSLEYAQAPNWDSVAHMSLIAAIEQAFNIMIDAEDVIAMDSFASAKRIVAKYL